MKRMLGVVAAICCAFALCFSLVGCGGVDKSGYLGNWSLESGTDATLDADSIALMKTLGLQVFLTLNEDGTGSMNMFGSTLDASWQADSATEGKITVDGKDSTLALADGKLTLTDADGAYLTFTKYEGEIPSTTAVSAAAASASAAAASGESAETSDDQTTDGESTTTDEQSTTGESTTTDDSTTTDQTGVEADQDGTTQQEGYEGDQSQQDESATYDAGYDEGQTTTDGGQATDEAYYGDSTSTDDTQQEEDDGVYYGSEGA